jgi:hypothetical protein
MSTDLTKYSIPQAYFLVSKGELHVEELINELRRRHAPLTDIPVKRLQELQFVADTARSDAIDRKDEYQRGYANGLILGNAIITGSEPDWLMPPGHPVDEVGPTAEDALSYIYRGQTGGGKTEARLCSAIFNMKDFRAAVETEPEPGYSPDYAYGDTLGKYGDAAVATSRLSFFFNPPLFLQRHETASIDVRTGHIVRSTCAQGPVQTTDKKQDIATDESGQSTGFAPDDWEPTPLLLRVLGYKSHRRVKETIPDHPVDFGPPTKVYEYADRAPAEKREDKGAPDCWAEIS